MAFDTAALDVAAIGQGITLLSGDCRTVLPALAANSVQCVVTSPPYWGLRDYGTALWDGGDKDCDHAKAHSMDTSGLQGGKTTTQNAHYWRDTCGKCGARRIDAQIGLEATPDAFIAQMVAVFRMVRRVLRDDGTLWLNLGSSYASGDTRSSRVQQQRNAPAYDSDDIEREGSRAPDCAYPDRRDECLTDSPNHRDRTADSGQLTPPASPLAATTAHDSGPRASTSARPSLLDALASTTASLSPNAQGASGLACVAVGPVDAPTLRPATSGSARKASSRLDTLLQPLPSVSRRQDKALSSRACDCGSCGICFAYLAMSCLRFKAKDLMLMPELVALALQADGWILRSQIVWHKPNPMPESCGDRPTSAYEMVYLLTKRSRYFYDADAVREPLQETSIARGEYGHTCWAKGQFVGSPTDDRHQEGKQIAKMSEMWNPKGRNCRNVWTIATSPFSAAHFATFPPELAERCIRAGTSERGCCAACGAPWVRTTERSVALLQTTNNERSCDQNNRGAMPRANTQTTTTGWVPTCKCDAPTQPCTILDPFAGAGTALLVADRLQRNAIGIELNTAYTTMAMERCRADAPLFSSWPPAEDPADQRMAADAMQRDLFGC